MSVIAMKYSPQILRTPPAPADDSLFDLNELIHSSLPPDTRIEWTPVKGRFSYSADLGIMHGDLMAVVADTTNDPDDLMLAVCEGSYFIRKRKWITGWLNASRLFLVSANPQGRIIGRIHSIVRMSCGVAVFFLLDSTMSSI